MTPEQFKGLRMSESNQMPENVIGATWKVPVWTEIDKVVIEDGLLKVTFKQKKETPPEPKWVAFTNEELKTLAGKFIRAKASGAIRVIIGIDGNYVRTIGNTLDAPNMLKYWEFLDGSPCGKRVEE